MNECLRFTDKNFKQEVLDSELPVFVDFWGSWCPPCKMVEPIMDDLASQLAGTIKVGKLNIDRNPATRSMFNIGGAPTFILFKNGRVLERIVGARSKKQLLEMIETALKSQPSKPSKTSKPQEAERPA
jgi:thioredoxin 1